MKSELNLDIPTFYSIRELRKQINDTYNLNIRKKDGEIVGVSVNILEKFRKILPKIKRKQANIIEFKIKLCADGTIISRDNKVINFNFSVLNDIEKAKSASGHYLIGTHKILNECYEEVKLGIKDTFDVLSINENRSVTIDDQSYLIKLFVCGDLKFLNICGGINAPNSYYPCLWCTCHKKDFWDLSKEWSIVDKSKGARSLEESKALRGKKNIDERKGYLQEPIATGIEFCDYVFDELHLSLRVVYTLFQLLLKHLQERDTTLKGKCTIDATVYVKRLNDFIKNNCSAQSPILIDGNSFKFNEHMSGNNREEILQKLDIGYLFSEITESNSIGILWKDFYDIFEKVKARELQINEIKVRCVEWMELFLSLYHRTHVTPYIHIFVTHLWEFVERHGDISLFSQQGHEKFNDISTISYFRSTNKREDYIEQLVSKRNRIELLSD